MTLCNLIFCSFKKHLFVRDTSLTHSNTIRKIHQVTKALYCMRHKKRSAPEVLPSQIQPSCLYCSDIITTSVPVAPVLKANKYSSLSLDVIAGLEIPLVNIYTSIHNGNSIGVHEYRAITDLALKQDHISRKQADLLLQVISSSAIPYPSEVKLLDLVALWQHFKNIGMRFDTALFNKWYNAYYRLGYISELTVVEEMATLEAQGLVPDATTCVMFMRMCCDVGDMETASQLLRYMKEENMTITIAVYNSLIRGHFMAGDQKLAHKLYDAMKVHNLDQNSFTYGEMMVGFARQGDMANIRKMVLAAQTDGTKIKKIYIEQILALFVSARQYNFVTEMFSILPGSAITQSLRDVLVYMLNHGTFELVLEIHSLMKTKSILHFLIAAVTSTISAADFEFCVRQLGKNFDDICLAARYPNVAALRNIDRLLVYFEVMERMDEVVKPHMYYPILCQYRKQKNLTGIINLIPKLIPTKTETEAESIDAQESCFYLIYQLKKCGISFKEITCILQLLESSHKEMILKWCLNMLWRRQGQHIEKQDNLPGEMMPFINWMILMEYATMDIQQAIAFANTRIGMCTMPRYYLTDILVRRYTPKRWQDTFTLATLPNVESYVYFDELCSSAVYRMKKSNINIEPLLEYILDQKLLEKFPTALLYQLLPSVSKQLGEEIHERLQNPHLDQHAIPDVTPTREQHLDKTDRKNT